MKKYINYLIGPLALCALFAAISFDRPASQKDALAVRFDENDKPEYYDFGTPKAIYKTWALDTITNTEKDTLSLPAILESQYQYSIQARVLRISGTKNVKFVLDQTNATGSTVWMPVDSVSAASPDTLKTVFLMKGANVWGNKHRIRVVGTGTQSTSYQVTALYKPQQ